MARELSVRAGDQAAAAVRCVAEQSLSTSQLQASRRALLDVHPTRWAVVSAT